MLVAGADDSGLTTGVDLAAVRPGDLVRARVTGADGVDLLAVPVAMACAAPPRPATGARPPTTAAPAGAR
jgi:hypothetical protein